MNCQICKTNIDEHDRCVLCSRKLCEACIARSHCEESTTFAHKPADRTHAAPSLKEQIIGRTDIRSGMAVKIKNSDRHLDGRRGVIVSVDTSDDIMLVYSVRFTDDGDGKHDRYKSGDVIDLYRYHFDVVEAQAAHV